MEGIIQVGIGVMLLQVDKILLGHRVAKAKDTGGIYEPDTWCLPGGKQEYKETILEGAARETKEETGLDISNMHIFHVADDIQKDRHFVTIQVIAKTICGEVCVMEPEKQDAWKWFSLYDLPEKIYTPSKQFIDAYLAYEKHSKDVSS